MMGWTHVFTPAHGPSMADWYRYVYEAPLQVGRLVAQVGDKSQKCTQSSWLRPYGVGLLVAGYDVRSCTPFVLRLRYLPVVIDAHAVAPAGCSFEATVSLRELNSRA